MKTPKTTHVRLRILANLSPTEGKNGRTIRELVDWIPSPAAFLNMMERMADAGTVKTYKVSEAVEGQALPLNTNQYTITARGRRILWEAIAFYRELDETREG